eukprot:295767_1
MCSSLLYMVPMVLFIHQVNSLFNQTLCFPSTDQLSTTTLSTTYQSVITDVINNTAYYTFTTSTCIITTLEPISTKLYDCFTCSLDPTYPSTETSRYNHLTAINNNIPTTLSWIQSYLGSSNVSYATYVTADTAPIRTECQSLPYPRICKFDLEALSPGINSQWEFTLVFSITSSKLYYEILYDTQGIERWTGVGFGPIGMDGDAVIYSCGEFSCPAQQIDDYRIELV